MNTAPPDALVVEDDPDLREIFVLLLEAAGLTAEGAAEVDGALDILRQREPKVLITDYRLTGHQTGLDLAREASRLYPGLSIIAVSGQEEVKELRSSGLFLMVEEKSEGYSRVVELAHSLAEKESAPAKSTP